MIIGTAFSLRQVGFQIVDRHSYRDWWQEFNSFYSVGIKRLRDLSKRVTENYMKDDKGYRKAKDVGIEYFDYHGESRHWKPNTLMDYVMVNVAQKIGFSYYPLTREDELGGGLYDTFMVECKAKWDDFRIG